MIQDTDHFGWVPGIREACDGVHAMVFDVSFQLLIDVEEVGPLGNLDLGGTVTFATAFQEGLDAISLGGSPQLKRGKDCRRVGMGPVDIGHLTHLDEPLTKAIPLIGTHFSSQGFWNGVLVDRRAGRGSWRASKIGVAGRVGTS